MAKKSYAVIGLGQFGTAVVEELVEIGADVIAIDRDKARVTEVGKILSTSFVADSTDEKVLKNLGVHEVDSAIIAFGGNREASVLTTVILRELGIKHIIVRADDSNYVPIFKRLGATEVVTPQKAAGQALANRLGNDDYKDYYILDDHYSVVSLVVNSGFIPVTLKDLNPKNVYGVNLLLIKRKSRSFVPGGNDSILPEDTVYVVGTAKEIKLFRAALNGKQK